ncbi:MAG: DUF1552 domain-containing protein [Myxococcales bacterium]|nr:DUF1552 domain-containing protein [Myxococcales bacterium]
MKLTRRRFLQGVGGATLLLPTLESFLPRGVQAQSMVAPHAIFFRQACGVAAAQNTDEIGQEPERFWPNAQGPLSAQTLSGRALDELTDYVDRLLVVGNVNYGDFDFGDGHARGAMQGLTGRPPLVPSAGGDSEAGGESLDHRIGRELNDGGRDSLFLYAGSANGWLGGPCISHRGPGERRAALHSPLSAYQTVAGIGAGENAAALDLLRGRQRSINDLVREQLTGLMGHPRLSGNDRQRLQLHFDSIRDLEGQIACQSDEELMRALDGAESIYESSDGRDVLAVTRLHMDVAVMAVACGYTRSVAIQVGVGNDGNTRYVDPDSGELMENFHYISHRRLSHDSEGAVIAGSDVLHHKVDRQFAQTFKYLLDRLDAFPMFDGQSLLQHGLAVWYNDNANGPAHATYNVPWILAGSAGGFMKQGQFIEVSGGRTPNVGKLHNTIASAVGVRKADGGLLDDFGDPSLSGGVLSELMA